MWRKANESCQDPEIPVCIAGYKGSSNAVVVSRSTEDLEFSAALDLMGRTAVTYLLWKEQTCDAKKESSTAERSDQDSSDASQTQSDSESEMQEIIRDIGTVQNSTGDSNPHGESDSDCESIAKTARKRPRVQSLDDDDDDFLDVY